MYGDWSGGIFGDGTYVKQGEIRASEVCYICVFHIVAVVTVMLGAIQVLRNAFVLEI